MKYWCESVVSDPPGCFVSDNGGQFKCALSKAWFDIYGVPCVYIPTSRPCLYICVINQRPLTSPFPALRFQSLASPVLFFLLRFHPFLLVPYIPFRLPHFNSTLSFPPPHPFLPFVLIPSVPFHFLSSLFLSFSFAPFFLVGELGTPRIT